MIVWKTNFELHCSLQTSYLQQRKTLSLIQSQWSVVYPFADAKFSGSKFYGKFNPQDFLCIIPDAVEDAKDYDLTRHGVLYAKLIILFKVFLIPKRPARMVYCTAQKKDTKEVEMAFIHQLDNFSENINPICKLDPEGKNTCF